VLAGALRGKEPRRRKGVEMAKKKKDTKSRKSKKK
jgi:hypothetical protein